MNRYWCFTLNNPDGLLCSDLQAAPDVRYYVYQHECGDNGTEHFQGYLELARTQRLSYVRSLIPGAHWEPRHGTQAQAIAYCKKEESRLDGPYEHGQPTAGQGVRMDILAFKKLVDDGATDKEIWDAAPAQYLRYANMLGKVRALTQPKRTWKTHVTLCYGEPLSGKSWWVREQAPDAYWKQANSKWFDDYSGQEDVVLDDFKAWLPWANLLHLLDAYPLTVETKGGQSNFIPRRIFITSNWTPDKWYGGKEDDDNNNKKEKYPLRALTRRINTYKWFLPGINFEEDPTDLRIETFATYDAFVQATCTFNS